MTMTSARKESAFHLALLVLVQWISLAVVILNATALLLLKNSQHTGLVSQKQSPADYMLLVLGSLSFLASSILLLLHLQFHYHIIGDNPYAPPRALSAAEVIFSVISIALWTVATSLILTHSQEETTSPCRFTNSLYMRNYSDICELSDTTIILAFAAIGSWVLVLLATLFILIRSPIPPTAIFTIEAPPQRFSQPIMVSLPDETYSQQPENRPYHMGHHSRIEPVNEDSLIVTGGGHTKERRMISHSNSNHSQYSTFTNTTRQTIIMLPAEERDQQRYNYYYNPQRKMVFPSPSLNNTTSTEEVSSSSYYSSRLPQIESQRSLSTLDSIFTGYPPIQLDLPVIQLGIISQMDVSFLEKI